ncbi:MAG: enoyl-CoA hydratase/isomerase family protein [Alphaproteobacteria bacterium]|nr:enoyl-CoA hydratase/isomerase family protein [Alphaproteobacteria bacterium SS10]
MSPSDAVEPEILFDRKGPLGLITLNRPRALNALNLPMIREMAPQLDAWAKDDSVAAVVITGAGEKAFCAGGDVKSVYQDGLAAKSGEGDGALTRDFFREEYQLNRAIYRFPKPYIALIDGITMGGGVGLSVHGSHRIATETTMVAMPETAIGLFPDVGATYVLARAPGEAGAYLALTGDRLSAADALYAKIATHHVPSDKLDALVDALASADWGQAETGKERLFADGIIEPFVTDAGEAKLAALQDAIDQAFGSDTVEEIIAELTSMIGGAGADGEWAKETVETMGKRSPTSMKIAREQLDRGTALDLESCLVMEYRLTQGCMAGHDFYEGIRAVLVDKDHDPKWEPAQLTDVTDAIVEKHFEALGENDLSFTG